MGVALAGQIYINKVFLNVPSETASLNQNIVRLYNTK